MNRNGERSISGTRLKADPKIRVLLVDDDRVSLRALEAILRMEHDVVATSSARRALDIAAAEAAEGRPFEVVCSDYQMPEMDGMVLLSAMCRLDPTPSCILVTGHVEFLQGAHRGAGHIL